jgi:K+-transporting ATPase ATPase C chain
MKEFFSQLRGAIMSTIVLAVVCCGIYPLVVDGLGQALFADKANGSLIVDSKGVVRGSKLIGQNFTGAKYFHPRPSAAGNNGYDPTSSSGSNLGPTSKKLADGIAQNVADYRSQNGLATNAPVPADAVTASASGLDPHISLQNAQMQAPRVAKERGMKPEEVSALISQYTDTPDLGFLGDAGVNVLRLNLALDGVK